MAPATISSSLLGLNHPPTCPPLPSLPPPSIPICPETPSCCLAGALLDSPFSPLASVEAQQQLVLVSPPAPSISQTLQHALQHSSASWQRLPMWPSMASSTRSICSTLIKVVEKLSWLKSQPSHPGSTLSPETFPTCIPESSSDTNTSQFNRVSTQLAFLLTESNSVLIQYLNPIHQFKSSAASLEWIHIWSREINEKGETKDALILRGNKDLVLFKYSKSGY